MKIWWCFRSRLCRDIKHLKLSSTTVKTDIYFTDTYFTLVVLNWQFVLWTPNSKFIFLLLPILQRLVSFLVKNTTIQMPVANWKRATSGRVVVAHTTLVPPLQLSYHSKIWSDGFKKSQERICISFSLQRETLPFTGHFTGRRIMLPAEASCPHLVGARKETRRPLTPLGSARIQRPFRSKSAPDLK